MQLGKRVKCPIHKSFFCCGRQARPRQQREGKWKQVAPGVSRIDDPNHPRGYRERRSKAAMDRLLAQKVAQQNGGCFYCHREFEDMREVTPDHRSPRMMGGGMRDDHPDNIVAACACCNREKGSKRDYVARGERNG